LLANISTTRRQSCSTCSHYRRRRRH